MLRHPLLTARSLHLYGFLICLIAMVSVLLLEHLGGLEPCPLCVFQRVATLAAGACFLIGALLPAPGPRRLFSGLAALGALGGVIVAGRHVWLQGLPPEKVPACGPDLAYYMKAFPLQEVIQLVFSGSGECAKIDWTFLGLTLPQYALLTFLALLVLALLALFAPRSR